VTRAAPHKGGLRVAFEGIGDRDAAERLRGVELSVPRSAVPAAPAGSYYEFELLGLACRDEAAGDLGVVVDLVADGGGWLLEVEGRTVGGVRRISLPFAEEFLVRVDRDAGRIEWRLPEGLIEACASES
jgi:16S rRNA processing protein RimM